MAKKGRPTNKRRQERQWTQVTQEILRKTSHLAELLRGDTLLHSMKDARKRIQEFIDAWIKSGEGDILPCSGENADRPACLNDVDVFQAVLEVIDMRIEAYDDETEDE